MNTQHVLRALGESAAGWGRGRKPTGGLKGGSLQPGPSQPHLEAPQYDNSFLCSLLTPLFLGQEIDLRKTGPESRMCQTLCAVISAPNPNSTLIGTG